MEKVATAQMGVLPAGMLNFFFGGVVTIFFFVFEIFLVSVVRWVGCPDGGERTAVDDLLTEASGRCLGSVDRRLC